MNFDIYKWPISRDEVESRSSPPIIETGAAAGNQAPWNYVPHQELVDAVNVALALGMPLLLTGEPGTGKSQLAYSIAWQLSLAGPYRFVAKSTSQAPDLFYSYDALGRFHSIEASRAGNGEDPETATAFKQSQDARNFIEYVALGQAILQAHSLDAAIEAFLYGDATVVAHHAGGTWRHSGMAQRSVVLIDEIDKAPRDFTNDLLDEVERMQFRVPEIGPTWTPPLPDNMRPIVIITSNSERPLPDAFLRRCLYYHLEFPESRARLEREQLNPTTERGYYIEDIVWERLGNELDPGNPRTPLLVSDAIAFLDHLRHLPVPLEKPPATAELLNWITAMRKLGANNDAALVDQQSLARRTLTALLKKGPDQDRVRGKSSGQNSNIGELQRWLNSGDD